MYIKLFIWLFAFFIIPANGLAKNTGESLFEIASVVRFADIDEIKKSRGIRILVPWSRTNYFLHEGEAKGFEYELVKEYEKFFNKDKIKEGFNVEFVFIPMPFSEILPALIKGYGDIAAANLTRTDMRAKDVLFSNPYIKNVKEIIVGSSKASSLNSIEDLSGKKVVVTKGSSYYLHLKEVNDVLKNKNLSPVIIEEADGFLRTEDLLEMVNAGIIDYTVADFHIVNIWKSVLKKMKPYPDVYIHKGGNICWAVQKDSKKLAEHINLFIKENKKGTLIGNILFNRYFKNTKWVANPLDDDSVKSVRKLIPIFKKYSAMYGFDWLLMGAQAFQESRLDNSVKSSAGAIGIMQLLPSTASDKHVNIPNIKDEENNIHAGIKYMAWLRDTYFTGDNLSEIDKVHFALAAYNCGPGKVKRIRRAAKEKGLSPDKWFFNVEYLAPKETRGYVANIHKYYLAYKTIESDKLVSYEE